MSDDDPRLRDTDALPDADVTLEDADATFDERELAAEVTLLDTVPDVGLYTPGAASDAFELNEDEEDRA
jgi:hypothetical protein